MTLRSPLSQASFAPDTKLLTNDEVQSMFSGALQFDIVDCAGTPLPRVVLMGVAQNTDVATDTISFAHSTFEAASIKIDDKEDSKTVGGQALVLETPDMRSFTGQDPGTVGYAYFLQLPRSDSKLTDDDDYDSTIEKRVHLMTDPEEIGLRSLNMEALIERLSELGERHGSSNEKHDNVLYEQKAAEMYSDLFTKVLLSSTSDTATPEIELRTSLDVQIAALSKILDIPSLWYDFSLVEWRIQLGQLLWSTSEDQSEIRPDEKLAMPSRDVVLLQITLASELLVRMKMISKPSQIKALSKKIQWDLILSQRFLDNIRIATKRIEDDKSNNRSSVFSALTFVTANESLEEASVEPLLLARHEKRQLEGLLKFSRALSWPHTEDIRQRFNDRERQNKLLSPGPPSTHIPAIGAYASPVTTPSSPTTAGGDYFEAMALKPTSPRPQAVRSATYRSVQLLPAATAYRTDNMDACGWLSRSWLTGLVLPGEAASHFLISTLLENSPKAIETLGDSANLYGGFIYSGRSYWSKSCIVGRVLAADQGASDCMGWISTTSVPSMHSGEWVNISTKAILPGEAAPRISTPAVVARASAIVRGQDHIDSIEGDDFTWPVDSPPVLGNEARYEGLELRPAATTTSLLSPINLPLPSSPAVAVAVAAVAEPKTPSTPTIVTSSSSGGSSGITLPTPSTAYLKFAAKSSSSRLRATVPLLHDIQFICSHPCRPSATPRGAGSSPPSPTPKYLSPPSPTAEDNSSTPACHPLHKSYVFEVVPAATLLSCELDTFTAAAEGQTLVLDCRGASELQLLARAWCAKVGEHALVGKVGRTCLACCVREAGALGVRIVIRI